MSIKKLIIFVTAVISLSFFSYSQSDVAVGQWKVYSNYSRGCDVDIIDNNLFYASKSSLVRIDLQTNTIYHLNRATGLSDVGVQCARANQSTKTVIICYQNSNIDLYQNGNISNIPDIYNKQISGDKTIYGIFSHDKYAYLACGFGVVILDLKKKIVTDSWIFTKNNQTYPVKDLAITQDGTIYAATDYALFKNNIKNAYIKNFATWESVQNINAPNISLFKQLALLNDNLYIFKVDTQAVFVDSVFVTKYTNNIYSYNNNVWKKETSFTFEQQINDDFEYVFIRSSLGRLIVGSNHGIKSFFKDINGVITDNGFDWGHDYITAVHGNNTIYFVSSYRGLFTRGFEYNLQGPAYGSVTAMDWKNSKLAAVHNSIRTYLVEWNPGYISYLQNNTWSVRGTNMEGGFDVAGVVIAPYDNSVIFATSFIYGLFEYKDNSLVTRYDNTNSGLELIDGGSIRTVSPVFDKDNNLWVGNWGTNTPVKVRMADGRWKSFPIPFGGINTIEKIFIDSRNVLWILCQRETRLMLFNPNGTPDNTSDDQWAELNLLSPPEKGDFENIFSIAEEKYGENKKIWIGTNKGLKYYYDPAKLLAAPNTLPEPVYITKDSLTELLLASEAIRCIKIDAGNRKWIGTGNAGVFLLSPDCKEEIFHFTTENSPLLSNNIHSIEINGETGEVYFGTENGLISFRYTATDAKEHYAKELKIFPNPVREDFGGYICIEGLKENSEVKITDAYGGLVYRTKSNGGTAVWDGKRFNGQKAATGVYFVFVSDESGKERKAGKILFIK